MIAYLIFFDLRGVGYPEVNGTICFGAIRLRALRRGPRSVFESSNTGLADSLDAAEVELLCQFSMVDALPDNRSSIFSTEVVPFGD